MPLEIANFASVPEKTGRAIDEISDKVNRSPTKKSAKKLMYRFLPSPTEPDLEIVPVRRRAYRKECLCITFSSIWSWRTDMAQKEVEMEPSKKVTKTATSETQTESKFQTQNMICLGNTYVGH